MMMKQSTEDEINDWAVNRYASTAAPSLTAAASPAPAAAPASSGMLSASTSTPAAIAAPAPQAAASPASAASTWAAAAAPAATPATPAAPAASAPAPAPAAASTSATTPAKAPAQNTNVANWYRNELGRDGDAAGMAYWQNRLNAGEDAQALYAEFARSAAANSEIVKPVDWASANTYTGPVSSNSNSITDEWGRNVLGRPLAASEQAQWDAKLNAATNPAAAQGVYQDFVNSYGSQASPGVTLAQASQISPAATAGVQAAQIAKADIATRTIDKPTETVQGQIGNVLAENSPVLQQARADAMRTAAGRGMLNSTMAASGGEDALIRSAAGIATTDAGAYNNAANYNAAAQNQATMWNADQVGQMQRLTMQQDADTASRAQQLQIAQMQQSTDQAAREQQLRIAQMQDTTSRYQSEMSANTAKYNSDASYRQQMDSQKQSLANNIIANMDLSPDRKAAMLESLGLGTSAKTNPDGSYSPGTGLAGAVYVIGSTTADLNPAASGGTANPNISANMMQGYA